MINLIKAECFKLSRFSGFKLVCLYNIAMIIIGEIEMIVLGSSTSTGYRMMRSCMGFTLHNALSGYLLAGAFLCSEFSMHTFGRGFLCGCSRRKVLWTKIFVFFVVYLLIGLLFTGICMLTRTVKNGFGQTDYMDVLFLLTCGIVGYMALGAVIIFVALAIKRAYAAVGVGMVVTYALLVAENFLDGLPPFVKYTYSHQLWLLRFPDQGFSAGTYFIVQILTIIIALTGVAIIFEKTELK